MKIEEMIKAVDDREAQADALARRLEQNAHTARILAGLGALAAIVVLVLIGWATFA